MVQKLTPAFLALGLGLAAACAGAPAAREPAGFAVPARARPEPAEAAPDLRKEIGALGIPECNDYVNAFEEACFADRGGTFPAPLQALVEQSLPGWREKKDSAEGREELRRECSTSREALRTFRCRAY
jgi:hypothetical protein